MLDEKTYIPKLRFTLLDIVVFYENNDYNLPRIKRLIYGLSSHWKILLVALEKNRLLSNEIKGRLIELGLNIEELIIIHAAYPVGKLQEKVQMSEIVYAPVLETLPVKYCHSRFRQPQDADQAIEALVYFSSALEDFSYESYYAFLRRTG